ncbi:MAG: hypothetical protein ACRCWQ_04015 [Bacilli bacterium]
MFSYQLLEEQDRLILTIIENIEKIEIVKYELDGTFVSPGVTSYSFQTIGNVNRLVVQLTVRNNGDGHTLLRYRSLYYTKTYIRKHTTVDGALKMEMKKL